MKKTAICILLLAWMLSFTLLCGAEQDVVLEYTQESQPYPNTYVSVDVERAIVELSRYDDDVWTSYLEGDVRCRWYLDGNELSAENKTVVLIQDSYLGCYLQAVLTCGKHTIMAKALLITEAPVPPQITTSFLPDATVGKPYRVVIESSDPGAVFALAGEAELLQSGLMLNAEGVLSGTPERAGVLCFTVTATGQGGVDRCTFTLTVNEAPHVHVYTEWETVKESTCLVQGKRKRNCVCGYVESEFLPLQEHSWDEGTITKDPTEEEKGERTHTCRECGHTATTEVEKLPHTHVFRDWVIGASPDCEKPGYRVRTCACGESETEYFNPTDHIWDAGVMTKEPSEAEEGEMTYICGYCGKLRTEPIAKLPHSHVYGDWVIETESSCTKTGLRVRYCACADVEREEIKKKEHSWDSGRVTKEPTEKAEGVRLFACVNCQQTKEEKIDCLPPHVHVYGDWQLIKESTCHQKGSKGKTCLCGDTIREELPLVEHVWDEGRVTKEPSPKEEGERTYTCTLCLQTKTERIEKIAQIKPIPKPQEPLSSDTSFESSSSVGTVRMIFLVTFLVTALIGVVTVVVLKRIK